MNQGGQAAQQGGQPPPVPPQQPQQAHIHEGAGADQPAQGGAVPPLNQNPPPGAADQQHHQNPPAAFQNGGQQNQHHQNPHGDYQGMPQAQQQQGPQRRGPFAQHPRNQTMGDFDSSDAFFLDRNPIRPPQPPRNDFEIKPQIIALVKQNQFHGLSTEHPLDHVDTFEEICSTTRLNGVSPDYFKCKLFTFSLSDKALRWVKSLPPQSITTWNEYKGAFLNQFYTKQRSNSIRSKISGFKQASMESFYEALERFKEYTRDCPNHGFSEGNLWNIFYNGIDHKYKLSLDTASNGNFMTKSVPEAKLLIENLAVSDANSCPEYNRNVRTTSTSSESAQISELKNMVSQLLKGRQGVHAIEDALATNDDHLMEFMRDAPEENQEEVNYIGGNYGNRGYNQPFRAHPNLSYRSTNVENPNDQVYPSQNVYQGAQYQPKQQVYPKGVYQVKQPFAFPQAVAPAQQEEKVDVSLKRYMEEQRQFTKSLYEKLDHVFTDLNNKFGSLTTHVQKLEVQIAQTAEAARKQNEVNSKIFCNIVSSEENQLALIPTPPQEEAEFKESQKPERFPWESKRAYKRRLENKPLEKQVDPGKFVITVSINGYELNDCLCDTGANVNLMSHALAKDLGFKDFKNPKVKMQFADLTYVEPYGILENVMLDIGERQVPTDFQIMVWEGTKRNQLLLGTPFLATAGAVIDFMSNNLSLRRIRQDVFYPSIDFKTAPSAIKLPPDKDVKTPRKEIMLPQSPRKKHQYPKPKEAVKPSKLKHEDVFMDISSVLSPTSEEDGAKEEPDDLPASFASIRILIPKDPDPKEYHAAKEKLGNTLKLFPSALVFKDGIGDDPGVPKPPDDPPGPENGEAKGSPYPLAHLRHT